MRRSWVFRACSLVIPHVCEANLRAALHFSRSRATASASRPLPRRESREARYCNVLRVLRNSVCGGYLAAIPPKADRIESEGYVCLVLEADIPRSLLSTTFGFDTRLRRGFFLARGCARWSPVVRRSTRQSRSVFRLVLRKERPAASTASMAKVRASTADERLALVRVSNSWRSSPFKGWPFAPTMLARHFPGSCSNAVISSPLYCIAQPRCVFIAGRKGEQGLAAYLKKTTRTPSSTSAFGRRKSGLRS
jgi:hypothetical protein